MDKEKVITKIEFPGVAFSVQAMGGMGGSHGWLYAKGKLSDLKPNAFGHIEITSLKGKKMTVNPMWCNEIHETSIIEMECEVIKWNGKYLEKCEYTPSGKFFKKWVSAGNTEHVITKTDPK